jgi:hypothetical protein
MNRPSGFQIHKFAKGELALCYLCGAPPSCLGHSSISHGKVEFGPFVSAEFKSLQVHAFCAQCALELSGLDSHWPFEEQP